VSIDAVAEPGKLAYSLGDELSKSHDDSEIGRPLGEGVQDLRLRNPLWPQQRKPGVEGELRDG
jgi:hypothetical protein